MHFKKPISNFYSIDILATNLLPGNLFHSRNSRNMNQILIVEDEQRQAEIKPKSFKQGRDT